MAIKIALNHRTHYQFDRLVTLSPHIFRLRPTPHSRTPILSYSFSVEPKNYFIHWQQDAFGNYLARLVFKEPSKSLSVNVGMVAEMTAINPFDFFLDDKVGKYPFDYPLQLKKELSPYFEISESGPRLMAWVKKWRNKSAKTIDFLVAINTAIKQAVDYTVRLEVGTQNAEETLQSGTGSCRDSAWLMVQLFRHLGIAARFVSGYLVQLKADLKSLDGPSGPDQDFTDLHAWAEVYIPGAGWIGLDATSGLLAGEGHIPLACTADYRSAAPIEGATDSCQVSFSFENTIKRIHEDPRVTLPYSDYEWQSIDLFGKALDKTLDEHDVRLTMGGEPTFISIDDFESSQWNTEADGEQKRERAEELLHRLADKFTQGSLRHYGQGKWYPGEPLPRWQLACYFRRDGEPIWRDQQWQADITKEYQYSSDNAKQFITTLCHILELPTSHIQAGYEDTAHYLLEEGKLPINISPDDPSWSEPMHRSNVLKVLDQSLGQPKGYLLPLTWNFRRGSWSSCRWRFRREYCFLIPGDSAMGLRLPIDSIDLTNAQKEAAPKPRDPTETRAPLAKPKPTSTISAQMSPEIEKTSTPDQANYDQDIACHTALVVEARAGQLYIFIPPITELEHYLHLIERIESVCESCMCSVIIEGYPPPQDHRLNKFMITPDPGVIEVNVHPAADWASLKHITTTLYEQARLSRLTTVRYDLDGGQTGTGGGNHITLGGSTPIDSPILRRPDLLQSFITYWQHHPALTYLFSGLFIGPTSQAPRVDEGRPETLYELETAFNLLPSGESEQPWLIDRLLRHLLTDITGNTHRAEFCIDKLYSPDNAQGRLGLVEFRSFEMPPHARMSLVQMLLLRTFVARFWQEPYKKPLIRWGTQLHDRFMLPHYVWQDILDVINDLNAHGYEFKASWLLPFAEFRFPVYGRTQIEDIELELRAAIEPWHVLGEESNVQGTARYVDSSVERVQIKVSRLTPDRYAVTCNGVQIPLQSTGISGEYVGAVRYRAWQPPSALHPTIGIHSPLVFDLVDRWSGCSVGGFTYHVVHPDGQNFSRFPVNGFEAEGRRNARFWSHGYTAGSEFKHFQVPKRHWHFINEGSGIGRKDLPEVNVSPEFPYTLDLRRT